MLHTLHIVYRPYHHNDFIIQYDNNLPPVYPSVKIDQTYVIIIKNTLVNCKTIFYSKLLNS